MGSEPEKKDKKPKLKATDIYFACEFCAFECDKDTQLKTHIDIAHSEELWLFPCQNCQFKAQGPKYLRQHNLTCPSNSTKDAIDENVQNIENIEKKTEEKEVINEVEIKSLNEDNVVNEQNSIAKIPEIKNDKKTEEETNDLKSESMLNFIEKSPKVPPKKIGLKRRRSKFELNETEEKEDSGSSSSTSSRRSSEESEEKKVAETNENEFSPEDSSSVEEEEDLEESQSQLSSKNLDGHFSVSSEVSSEDENHVLIGRKMLNVTLRGYKCSKCNLLTTLKDAINNHNCVN